MKDRKTRSASIPESLVVAIDDRDVDAVTQWWEDLSDEQRQSLLDDAMHRPDTIATQAVLPDASDDEQVDEWYEYVVNQDMRFYFDCHNGQQTSHGYLVHPFLAAISAAADTRVVSHILTRKRR